MKKIILLAVTVLYTAVLSAQKIGIGTTTPAFKLDVAGGSINTDSLYRIGGDPVLSVKGTGNTLAGINCGLSNTSGIWNTALGKNTLYSNTTGSYNLALGTEAMYSNITGSNNIASGYRALYSNTTGIYNTAIGIHALRNNVTGVSNTAIGANALYNVNNHYNTAIGYDALYSNTGYNNSAVGYRSLFSNTSGTTNTAMGYSSLYANTTGYLNTAFGSSAMFNNTSGSLNTAFGASSLSDNSTGRYNVAQGYLALNGNTNGEGNVGIGYWTLSQNGSSFYNTAVGNEAGRGHLHGWNNTFLGAFSNGAGTGFFNCIAIGANATTTASNQVRIGNSSNNSVGGYANWTNISDGRFKKNIKEDVKGLDFIIQLRPVTYQLDITGLRQKLNESNENLKESKMDQAIAEKESMIQTGFIAQDVEETAKKLGYDFSGVDKPKNENDLYGLRYAEFVVPLVKAVQEQQKLIEVLQTKIAFLETKIKSEPETTVKK